MSLPPAAADDNGETEPPSDHDSVSTVVKAEEEDSSDHMSPEARSYMASSKNLLEELKTTEIPEGRYKTTLSEGLDKRRLKNLGTHPELISSTEKLINIARVEALNRILRSSIIDGTPPQVSKTSRGTYKMRQYNDLLKKRKVAISAFVKKYEKQWPKGSRAANGAIGKPKYSATGDPLHPFHITEMEVTDYEGNHLVTMGPREDNTADTVYAEYPGRP